MPDLMRNHVRLREISRRVESFFQVLKETHIQIDPFVIRTVKGPHSRLPETARRLDGSGEEHKFRLSVGSAFASKDVGPGIFGVTQNSGDELFGSFISRGRRAIVVFNAGIHHGARVDAEIHRQQQKQEGAQTAAYGAAAHEHSTTVLNVGALTSASPLHEESLLGEIVAISSPVRR